MRRGRPPHDDILTPREWQVLRLVREGLTNQEIADRLGISLSAAKYHVGEILSKLEVPSRHEAVHRAEEHRRSFALLPLAWVRHLNAPQLVLATAVVMIVAIGVAALLIARWGGGEGDDSASTTVDALLGPDVAPEGLDDFTRSKIASPYQNTVLLAPALPANFSPEDLAIVESLPRVSTLRQLQAVLAADVNLIVVDSSAMPELLGSDFLYRQLQAGRAILELNVCLDEVHFHGTEYPPVRYSGEVTEIAPDGTVRRFQGDGTQPERIGVCALPMASGQVPFFAFRRLPTEVEQESMRQIGQSRGNHTVVNLKNAPGALGVVISRLDGGLDGSALPATCDEGRRTGLEHLVC